MQKEKLFLGIMTFLINLGISEIISANTFTHVLITRTEPTYIIEDSIIIVISGTVKNSLDSQLLNVEIEFNGKSYYTDSNGYFKIEINKNNIRSGLIIFHKDGFEKITRNYNVGMNSIEYNLYLLDLKSYINSNYNYGIVCGGLPIENKIIYFDPISDELNESRKIQLKEIASLMKANPSFQIKIQGFYYKHKLRTLNKYKSIVNYLTIEENIDKERLIINEPIKLNLKNGEENKIIFNK